MKKTIPFIFPLIIGLFSGWFIECFLCYLSIMISPFAGFEEKTFLFFCGISSLLSVLIITVVVIVDVMFLIELNNKKKIRFSLIAQTCVAIFICVISWSCADQMINTLYNFF